MTEPKPRSRAYLVAICPGTSLTIEAVRIFSDPPWCLTRRGGDGTWAVLLEASAETYEDARSDLLMAYPIYFPGLFARWSEPS